MRFPTILGLLLIILVGTLAFFIYQDVNTESSVKNQNSNIRIANIANNAASIIWESEEAYKGEVLYSTSKINTNNSFFKNLHLKLVILFIKNGNFKKDFFSVTEDSETKLHLAPIENLEPETTYYIKIKDGLELYPKDDLTFKTLPSISRSIRPVAGVVMDKNFDAISGALVSASLNDLHFASVTANNGNFLLPLFGVGVPEQNSLTLLIKKDSLQSRVDIILPLDNPLPPIQLGRDLDLKNYLISEKQNKLARLADKNSYDLNGDKKVNSLDLSIVLRSFGKRPSDERADIDGDGRITQKDVNLIIKSLQD